MRKNAKIPNWTKSPFEKDLERFVRLSKKEVIRGVKWLFFYPYKDKMDGFLHIIDVIALGFIAWRLLGG